MFPHLRTLHWLPMKQRIKFKCCLLFKVLKLGLPPYFIPYFVPYTGKIATRYSAPSKNMLDRDLIPYNRNTYKSKSHYDYRFTASGPSVWNSLPEYACDSLFVSTSIKWLPVSLSLSSTTTHTNGLTFWMLTAFLSPISIFGYQCCLRIR